MGDHDITSWVPLGLSLLALVLSVVSLVLGLLKGAQEAERRKAALVYESKESLQILSRDIETLWRELESRQEFYKRLLSRRIATTHNLVFMPRLDGIWNNRILLADGCKAAYVLHPYLFPLTDIPMPRIGQMQNGVIRPWDVKELAEKIVEYQWKSILREGRLDQQQKYVAYEVFSRCLPLYVADWLHGYREKHLGIPDDDRQVLTVQPDAWQQTWDARDRNGELQLLYNIAQACREDSEALIEDAIFFISRAFGLRLPGPGRTVPTVQLAVVP